MPGVVFVNPSAGSELSAEELRELFAGHRVVECPPQEIPARVADAVRERPDFVAVAGGDGTLRGAARSCSAAASPSADPGRHPQPLRPGGRDLRSRDGGQGRRRRRRPPFRRRRRQRTVLSQQLERGAVPDAGRPAGVLRADDVETAGPGGGRLGTDPPRPPVRPRAPGPAPPGLARLRRQRLLRRAPARLQRPGIRSAAATSTSGSCWPTGRWPAPGSCSPCSRARHLAPDRARTCPAAELGLDRARVEVALDGEVETLEPPLRYSVRREELAVVVPPDGGPDTD